MNDIKEMLLNEIDALLSRSQSIRQEIENTPKYNVCQIANLLKQRQECLDAAQLKLDRIAEIESEKAKA